VVCDADKLQTAIRSFVMWSPRPLEPGQLGSNGVAQHGEPFRCVSLQPDGWYYYVPEMRPFIPLPEDVLVAEIFPGNIVYSLEGQQTRFAGVTLGFATGNLAFSVNFTVASAPAEEEEAASMSNDTNATNGTSTTPTSSTAGGPPTTTTTTTTKQAVTVTTELSSPVSAGSTSIPVADVTGLSPGMQLTISDGNDTDTSNIVSVSAAIFDGNSTDGVENFSVNGTRRLSSESRRLLPGSVTVDTPLQHSYAAGASVTATVPQAAEAPTSTTTGLEGGAANTTTTTTTTANATIVTMTTTTINSTIAAIDAANASASAETASAPNTTTTTAITTNTTTMAIITSTPSTDPTNVTTTTTMAISAGIPSTNTTNFTASTTTTPMSTTTTADSNLTIATNVTITAMMPNIASTATSFANTTTTTQAGTPSTTTNDTTIIETFVANTTTAINTTTLPARLLAANAAGNTTMIIEAGAADNATGGNVTSTTTISSTTVLSITNMTTSSLRGSRNTTTTTMPGINTTTTTIATTNFTTSSLRGATTMTGGAANTTSLRTTTQNTTDTTILSVTTASSQSTTTTANTTHTAMTNATTTTVMPSAQHISIVTMTEAENTTCTSLTNCTTIVTTTTMTVDTVSETDEGEDAEASNTTVGIGFVLTVTTSPVSAGTTSIPVADVKGFSPGMKLTISDDTSEETKTIVSVTSDRRLSSASRRLATGIVTVDSPFKYNYTAGATVTGTYLQAVATFDTGNASSNDSTASDAATMVDVSELSVEMGLNSTDVNVIGSYFEVTRLAGIRESFTVTEPEFHTVHSIICPTPEPSAWHREGSEPVRLRVTLNGQEWSTSYLNVSFLTPPSVMSAVAISSLPHLEEPAPLSMEWGADPSETAVLFTGAHFTSWPDVLCEMRPRGDAHPAAFVPSVLLDDFHRACAVPETLQDVPVEDLAVQLVAPEGMTALFREEAALPYSPEHAEASGGTTSGRTPQVLRLEPNWGWNTGGTLVRVHGENLPSALFNTQGELAVRCDFGLAGIVEAVGTSPSYVDCVTPPFPKVETITVTVLIGTPTYLHLSHADATFRYLHRFRLAQITPLLGSVAGGTNVTLTMTTQPVPFTDFEYDCAFGLNRVPATLVRVSITGVGYRSYTLRCKAPPAYNVPLYTANGCTCKKLWYLPDGRQCDRYCCNFNKDANGPRCYVEDPLCEGADWGYCDDAGDQTGTGDLNVYPVCVRVLPSSASSITEYEPCRHRFVYRTQPLVDYVSPRSGPISGSAREVFSADLHGHAV